MAKWTKRILLTLAILFVVLLAAAIILPIAFKGKIEAAVKAEVIKSINAEVDWGSWDISLLRNFPNLSVEVNDIRVSNKAPFEGIDLARIGTFSAAVNFWALLGDNITLKRIALLRPHIHVKVLADGAANYDIAIPDSAALDVPEAGEESTFRMELSAFTIEGGSFIYDDATLPYYMDLLGIGLTGSGNMSLDNYLLKTVLHADTANVVYDGVRYLRNVSADITADIAVDMPNMKFTFTESEAAINRLLLGVDGWLAMPADDIDMDITWNARKTDLGTLLSLVPAEFARDLADVEMSGRVGFNGQVKGTYNDNSLPAFSLMMDVDNGRFKYPDLPAAVEEIFVDLKVNSPGGSDMDGLVVDLRRFALKMAGNPVEARMFLTTPISDPQVDAELKANLDLGSLKQVVPMEEDLSGNFTADVRVKGRMSDVDAGRYDKFVAEGSMILLGMSYASDPAPVGINSLYFDFTPRFLALRSFDGSLGSSSLQARGRLDNYLQWWLKDSTLTGTFELAANKFDLNELMGPGTEESATTGTASADTAKLSVIEVPGNIDFSFTTSIGEVIYDDLSLTNVRGGVRVHDQRIDLKDVFFNLFGGSVTMAGGYETTDPKAPGIDFTYNVKDLDIEQTVTYVDMVQKMAPIAKTAKGKFSTTLAMKARLDEHMEVDMNSLTGRGTLTTRNVRIDGFQPLVDIAKALKIQEIENTTLENVLFTYEFKDGRMITDPFDVKIDRIKARVGGSTAFADQAIDYDMTAKVPTAIFGAAAPQTAGSLLGEANKFLGTGFKVPEEMDLTIKMTGTIDKPIIKPIFAGGASSVKETVAEEVKEVINVEIGKAREEAIAKAKAERDRLIVEAQKQADQIKGDARREAARLKGEGYAAADRLVNEAKDPISKAAARLAADKAKQEADKREQQFVTEADKRADGIVDAARKQGDELLRKAEETDTTIR